MVYANNIHTKQLLCYWASSFSAWFGVAYKLRMTGSVPEFSHPCLVSAPFTGTSLLEMKFFLETFSPSNVRVAIEKLAMETLLSVGHLHSYIASNNLAVCT